jgi:hypothetical protein
MVGYFASELYQKQNLTLLLYFARQTKDPDELDEEFTPDEAQDRRLVAWSLMKHSWCGGVSHLFGVASYDTADIVFDCHSRSRVRLVS